VTTGRLTLLIALGLGLVLGAGRAGAEETPVDTIQALCDSLISSMKMGPSAGFAARRQMLEPRIRRALDLARMTRLVIGPPWRTLAPEQQAQLVAAFGDFSISTYANRFSGYSGEKFTVDPAVTRLESGDEIVHTTLKTGGPEPVRLDYLMRRGDGEWRVIDVFLNGTISELAARRSEYSAVLRTGGVPALVDLLRKKAAEMGG
jgi:phospholipid transport system substrate-binding protein